MWMALPVAVTLLGGALRMDALAAKYGAIQHPFWARVLTVEGAAVGRHLHPAKLAWPPVGQPYVGGDPYTYVKFAREMRSFYQGHVREPVFLAVTRGFLWLLSDRDIAVSFASALGSTLLVLATYLLGAAAFSRWTGLGAALVVAIDQQSIGWGVDGWRDDTFACAFTFAAWGFVRMRKAPSMANAALAGVLAAVACLTRITSLLFVLPALIWLILDAPRPVRLQRVRTAGATLVVVALLVSPYLINCARETGDPLIAINYHTRFYRFGEGVPSDKPMSAARYIGSKITGSPLAATDTATTGIFIWPLEMKTGGLDSWVRGAGTAFLAMTSVGLVLLLASGTGRLLLVLLLCSLVPYAFTWNIRGGGEWRFTLHAYSIYLVAACYAVECTIVRVRRMVTAPSGQDRWPSRAELTWTLAAIAAAGLAVAAYRQLPYYVAREAVKDGVPASVIAGDRDAVFFGPGWSDARPAGNVTTRVSVADRAIVKLPLPDVRPYDLVLRLDPVAPDRQGTFVVLLNGRMLGRLPFTWDPLRVGFYRMAVAPDFVRPGPNRLSLVAEPTVSPALVRDRYPFLESFTQAGVRLWYVRIEPK
jgi:hypothetical protein